MAKVPKDYEVQPLREGSKAAKNAGSGLAKCGTCGRLWDDNKVTSMTPTPSGRCPFEYFHDNKEPKAVSAPRVWVATAETQAYSFVAIGKTEEEAKTSLVRGFNRHLRQMRMSKRWTVQAFDAEWGISAVALQLGKCARDGELIGRS